MLSAAVFLTCYYAVFPEYGLLGRGALQDATSISLWSRTSAFSAIEPSAAVSQGKLTSLLIALLVITECSWSSAVSSLRGILSLRLSFLRTARSSNALWRIGWKFLLPTAGPICNQKDDLVIWRDVPSVKTFISCIQCTSPEVVLNNNNNNNYSYNDAKLFVAWQKEICLLAGSFRLKT